MDMTKIGRLAMRQEGGNWCAYYAQTDTMNGALFLGSIRMSIVMKNRERKEEFKSLMSESVADIIQEITGVRPDMGHSEPAPESERAGHS